jgi:serine/threonine-protein kinase HipA
MADVAVLDIRMYGKTIGALTRLPDDANIFAFDRDYIDDPNRPTLSLSFKDRYGGLITESKPTKTRVSPFFANLLPEGKMREYLAERAGVNPRREFFLLWVLGRDLAGAMEIHPADGESWPEGTADGVGSAKRRKRETALHFSLAGVQLKFSAIKAATGGLTIPADGAGGSWIVKLPSVTHEGVPENEYAMMELARRVGIDVPAAALVPIKDIGDLPEGIEIKGRDAYVIKRFDRSSDGERIHIEDFAQIFGVYPDDKYKSANYENIASVIWAEIGEAGIAEYVRRLVFNGLIGNGDMHLKNWSLIYPDRRKAALAPAYDFVSTIPYIKGDRMGLNLAGSKEFSSLTNAQFERFAAKARLPTRLVLDTVKDTVQAFAAVWDDARDLPIAKPVKSVIEAHLRELPIWISRKA